MSNNKNLHKLRLSIRNIIINERARDPYAFLDFDDDHEFGYNPLDDEDDNDVENYKSDPFFEKILQDNINNLEQKNYSIFARVLNKFFGNDDMYDYGHGSGCTPKIDGKKITNMNQLSIAVRVFLNYFFGDRNKIFDQYNLKYDENSDYISKYIIDLNNSTIIKNILKTYIKLFNQYEFCFIQKSHHFIFDKLKGLIWSEGLLNYNQIVSKAEKMTIEKIKNRKLKRKF